MARRLNISVAIWQLLASVPVLFCFVSKEWIVSSGQGETRGLFDICHSGNVSCNWTSDCAPCHPHGSQRTCTDFGDDGDYQFCAFRENCGFIYDRIVLHNPK